MNSDAFRLLKTCRSILIASICFALWPTVCGAVILFRFANENPVREMPFWKLGQFSMLCGLIWLALGIAVFVPMQKLLNRLKPTDPSPEPQES
jgi:hypothetical protein